MDKSILINKPIAVPIPVLVVIGLHRNVAFSVVIPRLRLFIGPAVIGQVIVLVVVGP